eukprot:g3879.t1
MDWDSARRKARGVEKNLSASLQRLRELTSSNPEYDIESSTYQGETEVLQSIEKFLYELHDAAEAMATYAGPSASAVRKQQVQRCRSVLHESKTDFLRLRESVLDKRKKHELLRQVDGDVKENGATDHLLRERRLLESGLQQAATLNAQADSARTSLANQRNSLGGTASRLINVASSALPGAAAWIKRIRARRSRQQLVLASVFAILIMFTMWWFTS